MLELKKNAAEEVALRRDAKRELALIFFPTGRPTRLWYQVPEEMYSNIQGETMAPLSKKPPKQGKQETEEPNTKQEPKEPLLSTTFTLFALRSRKKGGPGWDFLEPL